MQVDSVKNIGANCSFKGIIVDTSALRKFKSGLNAIEFNKFEKYVKDIENIDDGKRYIYAPIIMGDTQISKIYKINENDIPISPPLFIDYGKKPLNIFKQLADMYNSKK